jgi:[pyruvate, water dikinase]-phosphate phosphotransferase / [pyruvate, water dikinase] kinase
MTPRQVFFVSDSTGITAETLGNSVLTQFDGEFVKVRRPFIATADQAVEVIKEIAGVTGSGDGPLVFLTVMDRDVRAAFDACPGLVVDLLEHSVSVLEAELGQRAARRLGRAHGISDAEKYHRRMAAVEFALEHDDGQSVKGLGLADVVLVGPSRVGKTPTGMYLAVNHGVMAANYPLLDENFHLQALPDTLRPLHKKLFGLISSPQHLHRIRSERRPHSTYSSMEQCEFEVRAATTLFQAEGVRFVDTTSQSIEEISAVIIQSLGLGK